MGGVTSMNSFSRSQSLAPAMTAALTFITAVCSRERIHRWRLSSRSSSLWYSVIGNGWAEPSTLNAVALSSFPPGARLSSNSHPCTTTEDSTAAPRAASNSGSGRFPFFTVTWITPEESLRTRKTMAPLDLARYIQPRASTSLSEGWRRSLLIGRNVMFIRTQFNYLFISPCQTVIDNVHGISSGRFFQLFVTSELTMF
jgi:hypothetical protein